jgi:hypothetical protein
VAVEVPSVGLDDDSLFQPREVCRIGRDAVVDERPREAGLAECGEERALKSGAGRCDQVRAEDARGVELLRRPVIRDGPPADPDLESSGYPV